MPGEDVDLHIAEPLPPPEYPWDQRPAESARAYAAFRAYLDYPMGRRSLRELSREAPGRESWPFGSIGEWSLKHSWQTRADAWDRHVAAEAMARQAEDRIEANIHYAGIARAASLKLLEAIRMLNPAAIEVKDFARLLEVCFRTERLALGMSDRSMVEVSGPGGDPVALSIPALDADERRAALANAVQVAAQRLETISRQAGRSMGVDTHDGGPIPGRRDQAAAWAAQLRQGEAEAGNSSAD